MAYIFIFIFIFILIPNLVNLFLCGVLIYTHIRREGWCGMVWDGGMVGGMVWVGRGGWEVTLYFMLIIDV